MSHGSSIALVHAGDATGYKSEGDREVNQDEYAALLEQVKALRMLIEALSARLTSHGAATDDALHHARAATVELHGIGGNPGLSQQVFALRERLDAKLNSAERELESSRDHSTHMLRVALEQQNQLAESLRTAIRSLENNQHEVRTQLDGRLRDIEANVEANEASAEADYLERLSGAERSIVGRIETYEKSTSSRFTDLNKFVQSVQEESKLKSWAVLIACTAMTIASLASIYFAVRGGS